MVLMPGCLVRGLAKRRRGAGGGWEESGVTDVWILCTHWDKRFATVTGVMKFSRQTETKVTVPRVLKRNQDSAEAEGHPAVPGRIRISWGTA